MSRFLKLCEQVQSNLNEDLTDPNALAPTVDPNAQAPAPEAIDTTATTPPVDPNEPSALPIVSNDEIAELANSLQTFYKQDNPKLSDEQVNDIKALNPANDKTDEAIKNVVLKLISIFKPNSPSNVEIDPAKITNSDND